MFDTLQQGGRSSRSVSFSVSFSAGLATAFVVAGCCLATAPARAQSSPLGPPRVTGVVEFEKCGIDCDLGGKTFIDAPLMVTVTPNPVSVVVPGGNVTFTVLVHNRSTVESAMLTGLVDNIYGDLTLISNCLVPPLPVLDPDDSLPLGPDEYSCTFDGTVSGGAGQFKTNTVTATLNYDGVPLPDGTNTPEGSATVSVLGPILTTVNPTVDRPPPELGPPALRNGAGPAGLGIANPIGPLEPTGPTLPPPYEELSFSIVNDSGIDVTIEGGNDLRMYDLRRFSFDPAVRGQALIDFDWTLQTDNTLGTTLRFRAPGGGPPLTPIRSVCIAAGDFGADDDGLLELFDMSIGPLDTDAVAWPATATWPFAVLKVENAAPGGITDVLFSSGLNAPPPDATYPNSVFIDDISLVHNDVVGPPGVPDGTVGKPMIVDKSGFCTSNPERPCANDTPDCNFCTGDGTTPCVNDLPDCLGNGTCGVDVCAKRVCTGDGTTVCVDDTPDCNLNGTCEDTLQISWDTLACCRETDDHHLLWGVSTGLPGPGLNYELGAPAEPSFPGGICGIDPPAHSLRMSTFYWAGSLNPADADPVGNLMWWIIVGSKGGVEGSWGKDSTDAERTSLSPVGCELKSLANSCGHAP